MSVATGLLCNDFSIIAADTRLTNIESGKQSVSWDKLIQTSFGFFATTGGVRLETRFFKEFLDTHQIRKRNDIYVGFLRGVKKAQDFAMKYCPEAAKELSSTQYIYSLNYFKEGAPHTEINVLDFAYEQRKLNQYNTLIVNPPKTTKRINRFIEKYSGLAKGVQDIHAGVYLVACLIDDISKINKWVDNNVNCGISLVLSESEILLLKVEQNAKIIKKLYKKKGDLSEIMRVCGNPLNNCM